MTVRKRGARWAVEIYDPARDTGKRYVGTFAKQSEAREAERAAQAEVARRRGRRDESVGGFAARWLDLRPREKESTNIAYREQVKPFVERHGSLRLRDVDVPLALEWLREKRWTHGGVRAMFSDARRQGLIDVNPFTGLRLKGSRGRADLDVLSSPEVGALCDCAAAVWSGEAALTVRALIATCAYVGMRPAELYGLRWEDLDFKQSEVRVERQYSAKTRTFALPKNGRKRTIVLTGPAREALLALPRPVNGRTPVFRGSRGGPITGRTQHYYWHPVRCRFGRSSMDLYDLRHFCASWLLNDLGLPAQDVAHQLGHTDGGALVLRLYGHPSEKLARERIKRATGGNLGSLVALPEAERRHAP